MVGQWEVASEWLAEFRNAAGPRVACHIEKFSARQAAELAKIRRSLRDRTCPGLKRLLRTGGLLLLAYLLLAALSFGQMETATVSGVITDQTGAVVLGAEVTVVNTDTNATIVTKTNAAGVYVANGLKPGHYRMHIAMNGFNEIDLTELTLNVQDDLSRNFKLRVGSTSQSISVEGNAGMIETSGAVSTVIDRQFAENLPLNGRSFNTLLQLTPGVVLSPAGFNVNGQRDTANYYTVDGVSASFGVGNNAIYGAGQGPALTSFGGTNSLLSIDALQEFRIQTSSFAPEFGRTPGGQIDITTRSGTNNFHGDIFNYFRNDALDANDWFYDAAVGNAPLGTISKPALRQNDFGGVFGGPIIKNKTFFFASYEGLRLAQPQVQFLNVPSLESRQSIPAPFNQLINIFPLPNGVDFGNGFAAFTETLSARESLNVGSIKIDHALTRKISLFGRTSIAASPSTIPLYNYSTNSAYPTWFLTLGANAQLTPHLLNQLRFNYSSSKSRQSYSLNSDVSPSAIASVSSLLIPSPFNMQNALGNLYVHSADFANSAYYFTGSGNSFSVKQWNIVDTNSYNLNQHLFKFGIDYRRSYIDSAPTHANFSYLPTPADLAVGGSSFNFILAEYPASFVDDNWSVYGQDTYRINHNIVLTYGIRWDIDTAPRGINGTRFLVPQNINVPANLTASASSQMWNTKYRNFAPRIGAAYSPLSSNRLVFRSGFGIFYDLNTANAGASAYNYPFADSTYVFNLLSLPLVNPGQYLLNPGFNPPFTGNNALFLTDPNLTLPYSLQWNFGAEFSLTRADAITVTYVGQSGDRLLRQESLSNPNSNFGAVKITGNGSRSNYESLQIQYRHTLVNKLQILSNYTWAHSLDDVSANAGGGFLFALYPVTEQYGNSSFDVRHNFSTGLTYAIPCPFEAKPLRTLLNGWELDSIIYARSGFPIDIMQGNPSQSVLLGESRPDLVPGQPFWISDPQAPGGQRINSAAFALRPPTRQGTLPRNAVPGFGFTQWDPSVQRSFALTESWNLHLRLDLFNVLNHPNFSNPEVFFNSSSATNFQFGIATQMLNNSLPGLSSIYQNGGARSLQISMKLNF